MAASDKIFKILDIENKHQGKEMLKQDLLNIELSHLSFQYDKRPILKDISFKIQAGQFIGIVGESGSGKSTIAKLVMGNYQHYDGSLLIQNQERYDIADTSFLKRIMYITHEPMIFKGTLRDNLDFYHQYSDEELYLALKKVSLDQYFKQLEGLDTLILEAGSNLSGGQRQRINLARALLADSEIYIFDEATSQIDVESEENIIAIIKELARTKTIIMITHRLSTVTDCDEILVMQKGQLIERGKHQKLMLETGVYQKLFHQQKELEAYQG